MRIGKKLGVLLAGLLGVVGVAFAGGEVFAVQPDKCDTAVLDPDLCDGSDGEGVYAILGLVINILTGAIAAACTIGIVISGIIWGTAAGDVGKVKNAQKRIIEIVTGMVVLALMWAFLNWLIPGGVFN